MVAMSQGLQIDYNGAWHDIGGDSGCAIATLLTGELLTLATGGRAVAPRHRVAMLSSQISLPRTVATFFFQPRLEQTLKQLTGSVDGKHGKDTQSFAEWKQQRYGAYFRNQK